MITGRRRFIARAGGVVATAAAVSVVDAPLATEVIKTESEKSPMARKVHASFTKFQALMGPWDHVADSAYHQFVAS